MAQATVLVVDDEPDIRNLLSEILTDEGYRVLTAADAAQANELRRQESPDLVLLDVWMPDADGISVLKQWSNAGRLPCAVVMLSGHASIEAAVEATKLGATDFIEKPISLAKLLACVEQALREFNPMGDQRQASQLTELVGVSSAISALRERLPELASVSTPVLILGEAGTGKRLIARHVHSHAAPDDAPFVDFRVDQHDADQLPEALFGCGDTPGAIGQSGHGTLVIADIADIPRQSQRRLASALESRVYTPVESDQEQTFAGQVVALSRHGLAARTERDSFSKRLFYHLESLVIAIPPLRERPEDVPELVKHFSEALPNEEGVGYRRFTMAAQNRLRNHSWPGNVRELKNLVRRCLLNEIAGDIELEEVNEALAANAAANTEAVTDRFDLPLREAREAFEKRYLETKLVEVRGSVGKLAELVGMERTHLYRKLRQLGIDAKAAARREA